MFESRLVWATYVLAIPLAASFAGRWHWAFDLATHFRAQYAACGLLLALGLLLCRRFRPAAAALALALVNVPFLAPFYLPYDEPGATPSPDAPRLKIVALNVYAGSGAHDAVIDYLRAAKPDVAVFAELTPAWRTALKELEAEFPERHFLARNDAFGLGIIAKAKLNDVRFEPLGNRFPYVRATFELDHRLVTLFGVHPPPPMGAAAELRNQSFVALKDFVDEVEGPVIVVGDFNSSSWSPYFVDLSAGTKLRDSRLGRGLQPSWSLTHPMPLRIPIDHALVSPEVHIYDRRTGANVGSDHLPVELEFSLRR